MGVFAAQILGLHQLLGKEEHWPLILSVVVVPTFIQLMLLPWFPESPRYLLIEKHNVHATITALNCYRAKCNIQAEIEEMQKEQHSLSSVETLSVRRLLLDDTVRWQVLSVVVINIGMQLSGIDAIWFYTNDIFENAGIPAPEIPYTTAGTGIIEIIVGLIVPCVPQALCSVRTRGCATRCFLHPGSISSTKPTPNYGPSREFLLYELEDGAPDPAETLREILAVEAWLKDRPWVSHTVPYLPEV
ncbi:unnamed protein product [Pleuronectes platessa]|uniref:Uncharacterized protein n=1 Tax=Pleuronectes platessa TaxID=8262 RepID=A0A9N7YDH8_PLEPL|nr:unnamed protein product [Pleuronectes platessa]